MVTMSMQVMDDLTIGRTDILYSREILPKTLLMSNSLSTDQGECKYNDGIPISTASDKLGPRVQRARNCQAVFYKFDIGKGKN